MLYFAIYHYFSEINRMQNVQFSTQDTTISFCLLMPVTKLTKYTHTPNMFYSHSNINRPDISRRYPHPPVQSSTREPLFPHGDMIPESLPLARATRFADRQHPHALCIPRCRTSQFQRSFLPWTVKQWNELPADKFHVNLQVFKKRCNEYLQGDQRS